MKFMIVTAAAALSFAAPAFAQTAAQNIATITCADFTAMANAGQDTVLQFLGSDGGSSASGLMGMGTPAPGMSGTMEEMRQAILVTCAGDPSLLMVDTMTLASETDAMGPIDMPSATTGMTGMSNGTSGLSSTTGPKGLIGMSVGPQG